MAGLSVQLIALRSRPVVAAMLLILAVSGDAQPARNVGIVPDAERARVGFDSSDSAGLFVGIREFEDPQLAEVPYAVDDAVDLAYLFVFELALVPASKVVLALEGEPQKEGSKARLRELRGAGAGLERALRSDFYRLLTSQAGEAGPRGLFVVVVASHGFTHGGLDNLVTWDSVRTDIEDTGMRVTKLLEKVAEAGSPRQLVLLDACRERLTKERAVGSQAEAAFGRPFVKAIERAKGQVVLAAATVDGYAYDDPARQNGVFTAAVLDGLRGGAVANDMGLVTVESLADFVQDRVASWVRRHRPRDAERSRGITRTLEGPVAGLPLAIDRDFADRVRRFEERKAAALERLKSEIGPVISGRMYDDVAGLLADASSSEAEPWLERIEALDGTSVRRESFAYFFSRSFENPAPLRAGDPWTDPAIGMKFRYIPAGTFLMGSPEDEPGRSNIETRHEVTLTHGYWMGETEVTQAQWRAVMGNNPSHFKSCGDDCPAESVNWFEAVAYANALSERAGFSPCYRVLGPNAKKAGEGLEYETVEWVSDCTGYRLPTDAEWERAARAESSTALFTGDLTIRGERNGPELDPIAWYGGNSGVSYSGGVDCSDWKEKQYPDSRTCGPHSVGEKQPNRWGLHDTLGNVWEWTWDWWGSYQEGKQVDPIGSKGGAGRVIRGGSWDGFARIVRAAYRGWDHPGERLVNLGFRLSRGQEVEPGESR